MIVLLPIRLLALNTPFSLMKMKKISFDFAFANLMNANVGTPQDGDQGLGRARQTNQRIVYIAEAPEGTRTVRKGQGEKHLIEKFGKEADLTGAEAWEKVWWHCRVQAEQYRLANRARGNGFSKRMSSLGRKGSLLGY